MHGNDRTARTASTTKTRRRRPAPRRADADQAAGTAAAEDFQQVTLANGEAEVGEPQTQVDAVGDSTRHLAGLP